MGVSKLASKMAEYNDRLENGKASEIKPGHVKKVLEKLRRKEAELQADLAEAKNDEKIERLQRKLSVAREHIARAEWLLSELA